MTDVFDLIAERLGALAPNKTAMLALSGPDAAGKTTFAARLAARFAQAGRHAHIVHGDDFLRPRAQRYAGPDEAENYLALSFDFDALERLVLTPLAQTGALTLRRMALDVATDRYSRPVALEIAPGDVVIVEGVFLLRPALRRHFDLAAFLWIDPAESMRRGLARDAALLGADGPRRYRDKYLPAQRRHLERDDPLARATFVIDNSDFNAPFLMSAALIARARA